MAEIIARQAEFSIFDQILNKEEAALVALYGRRRIGKTFLVEQYFTDKGIFFHLLGVENARLNKQLVMVHQPPFQTLGMKPSNYCIKRSNSSKTAKKK